MADDDFLAVLAGCRDEWERARAARAASLGLTLDELDRQEAALEAQGRERARAAEIDRAIKSAVWRSGLALPADSRDALFADALREDPKPMRAVHRWLESQIPALVLCGGVGTGKTVAAARAVLLEARRVAEVSDEGVLRTWLDVSGCRAAELGVRSAPYRDEADRVERVRLDAALFVLDDLGTEAKQDTRFSEALFVLVDNRQTIRRRTIITTNLAPADIRPRYGDRIADRLNHIGRAVQCRGESMRRKGDL